MKTKSKELCPLCQSGSAGVEEIKEFRGIQTLKIFIQDGVLRLQGGIKNVKKPLSIPTDDCVDLVYKINYCPNCGRYVGSDANFEHKRDGCICCQKHKYYDYNQNLNDDFEITMVMEYVGRALWFYGEVDNCKKVNEVELIKDLEFFQHWFAHLHYCPMCGKHQTLKDLRKYPPQDIYWYPNREKLLKS